MKIINQNLKEIRQDKGLLQKDIAYLTKITPAYYCLIENGKRRPSLERAKKLSNILGISLDKFYESIE